LPFKIGLVFGSRSPAIRQFWLRVGVAVWLLCAVSGLRVLWAYDNAAGVAAQAPARWPSSGGALALESGRPTLVFLAHPQCSCTGASLTELAEVLARAETRPKTYVVFLKPEGTSSSWEQTDLWRTAAALPDVTLVRDDDGREARRFGVATSGQTLLYSSSGALMFSGGITGARAHAGDNAGRQALVTLLNHGQPERKGTSVFGCPLFAQGT
jgi:hypothetical protein